MLNSRGGPKKNIKPSNEKTSKTDSGDEPSKKQTEIASRSLNFEPSKAESAFIEANGKTDKTVKEPYGNTVAVAAEKPVVNGAASTSDNNSQNPQVEKTANEVEAGKGQQSRVPAETQILATSVRDPTTIAPKIGSTKPESQATPSKTVKETNGGNSSPDAKTSDEENNAEESGTASVATASVSEAAKARARKKKGPNHSTPKASSQAAALKEMKASQTNTKKKKKNKKK